MNNTAALIALALVALLILAVFVGRVVTVAGWRVSPTAMQHYEHALADMQQRLERTELRGDRQQERIDQLQAALEVEQDYSRALARAMRDAGLEPPPRPAPTSRQQAETNAQVVLWQQIAAQFDLEEQAELWFEMGWASAMRGETAGERARALVAYAARRGCLDRLAETCREKRPNGGF